MENEQANWMTASAPGGWLPCVPRGVGAHRACPRAELITGSTTTPGLRTGYDHCGGRLGPDGLNGSCDGVPRGTSSPARFHPFDSVGPRMYTCCQHL